MNHEGVNSNQHQDNGDMNHDVEESTHQQLLSVDSGIDHDLDGYLNMKIQVYYNTINSYYIYILF